MVYQTVQTHFELFTKCYNFMDINNQVQWRRRDLLRRGARNHEKIIQGWHSKILWNLCNKQWQSYWPVYLSG